MSSQVRPVGSQNSWLQNVAEHRRHQSLACRGKVTGDISENFDIQNDNQEYKYVLQEYCFVEWL